MMEPRAVPSFVAATRIVDSNTSTVVSVSSSNPELAAALASLDGYTLAEQRLAKLADAYKDWSQRAMTAAAGADAETAIRAAIDEGTLDKLPASLAKESHRAEVLHAALRAACTTGSSLRNEQISAITGGVDTILAALDTRLRGVVADVLEHRSALEAITTAEDAIEAGVSDSWRAVNKARETIGGIRAAQSTVLRNLASDRYQWLAEDNRRMLAIAEVEDWRVIEERLPQIIRHGGIWAKNKHKGREGERVERWIVPWPEGQAARTAWLLEHHPEQMRVPSLQALDEGREKLQHLTSRATPTGGQAEPQPLTWPESINTRKSLR